jgi:hypothetical protein
MQELFDEHHNRLRELDEQRRALDEQRRIIKKARRNLDERAPRAKIVVMYTSLERFLNEFCTIIWAAALQRPAFRQHVQYKISQNDMDSGSAEARIVSARSI